MSLAANLDVDSPKGGAASTQPEETPRPSETSSTDASRPERFAFAAPVPQPEDAAMWRAQEERLSGLRGKAVAFVTSGCSEKRFIYEKAKDLGVELVLLDTAGAWGAKLMEELGGTFLPVELTEASCLAALEAYRRLHELHGIVTFAELSVPLAARLAQQLQLPGPPPEATEKARSKALTRQAMRRSGLPGPRSRRVLRPRDLRAAARIVGFPAVLKPESGAASKGVKKVRNLEELEEAYEEGKQTLMNSVVRNGNLQDRGDDCNEQEATYAETLASQWLLEEYLEGEEVDVDVIMSDGQWVYAAVSDNGPTQEPYFNETWAVTPSLLPVQKQMELRDMAIHSVKALGFSNGIFHVELKYTSQGARLLEVNARMGGGPVYITNLRTWGVDLIQESLFHAVGLCSMPPVPSYPYECIANADINTKRSGVLLDLDFMEPLQRPEVKHVCHVKVGEHLVGPEDGLPTWLVEVVVSGPTPQEALNFYDELEKKVQEKLHLSS